MPTEKEIEVIEKLKDLVARGDIGGVRIAYRVSGGMPSERFSHEEFEFSGRRIAKAKLRAHDVAAREATGEIDELQMREVLKEIADSAADLIPRSEARFLPDSLVGSITIHVDDKEASFFFLADEEEQKQQDKPIPSKAAKAIDRLSRLSRDLLRQ